MLIKVKGTAQGLTVTPTDPRTARAARIRHGADQLVLLNGDACTSLFEATRMRRDEKTKLDAGGMVVVVCHEEWWWAAMDAAHAHEDRHEDKHAN